MNNISLFKIIAAHQGHSTGHIAEDTGIERETLKQAMRDFEKAGLGEYAISDGMYHFWLSAKGRSAYDVLMSLEQG